MPPKKKRVVKKKVVKKGGKGKGKGKGGPPKGISNAVKQRIQREKEERERLEREEEEKRLAVEEEKKREQEEEEERQRIKEARKARKKAKREELRRKGQLKSKSQMKKINKGRQDMQKMIDAGLVRGPVERETEVDEDGKPIKKKVRYAKKKKGKKKGFGSTGTGSVADTMSETNSVISGEDLLSNDGDGEGDNEFDVVVEVVDEVQENKQDEGSELEDWEQDLSGEDEWDATSDDDEEKEDLSVLEEEKKEEEQGKKKKKYSTKNMRSPICCVLGHVDVGKTKILDKIRSTSVQDKEAGGITQQIGASYFPMDVIKDRASSLNKYYKKKLSYKLPGLLVIDTPGHEAFTNLRSRGSSLCDIAVLVVDLMHSLEPQTIESLNMLKKGKIPFVVVVNKVDRLYGWEAQPWSDFRSSLYRQRDHVQREFEDRLNEVKLAFAVEGLNTELYYENIDPDHVISFVPTSAHTGEGLPDLMMLLIQLTQKKMKKKLQFLSELECTVLEVKRVEGQGTTIDVILSNGELHRGDRIVLCGMNGPIATNVRALLTPAPLREIRVKSKYDQLKTVKAAAGIKIAASGLDEAIAGSSLLVVEEEDDEEDMKEAVMQDLESVLSRVDRSGVGVHVQASSIGSLEALLGFLKDMDIPVAGIGLGPIFKKDINRASIMLEREPKYAVILAFDVDITAQAERLAIDKEIQIFSAEIIYHLFDQFTEYLEQLQQESLALAEQSAVFPSIVSVLPDFIFNQKNPIIIGVRVEKGILRIGTPLAVPDRDNLDIGRVVSIELNQNSVEEARVGDEVAIRIEGRPNVIYGRHFDETTQLCSKLSRHSIDLLKENFKDYLGDDEWRLVIRLKKVFDIQ